jgi:hypothetical protein
VPAYPAPRPQYIKQTWGSPEQYLLEAGFSAADMQRLRAALLRPEAGGSITAPRPKL